MTVWKAGMLAVCVDVGVVECSCGKTHLGVNCPDKDTVVMIDGLVIDKFCACPVMTAGGKQIGLARRFRPAVEDRDRCEDEFITLLKRSKPAPAQPHEAKVQVRGDSNNSPAVSPFAAAGDSTASNLVSPDPVEKITHTDRTEGVTHRDLSQHADSGIADLNCFAPFHVEKF